MFVHGPQMPAIANPNAANGPPAAKGKPKAKAEAKAKRRRSRPPAKQMVAIKLEKGETSWMELANELPLNQEGERKL